MWLVLLVLVLLLVFSLPHWGWFGGPPYAPHGYAGPGLLVLLLVVLLILFIVGVRF